MSNRWTQSGYTLIELILVMAIGSMLVIVALAGFSSWRMSLQFSDSIDGLKETMTALRTESQSNINLRTAAGETPANVTFGRLVTFTPGSSTFRVDTLRTANTNAPGAGQAVVVVSTETRTIKWGVTYTGPRPRSVAFTQSLNTARMQTAWRDNWNTGSLQYGQFVPSTSVAVLQFRDSAGRTATVRVDPASNGVTRSIP